jgi:uncharacterized protein (DUF1015 family)
MAKIFPFQALMYDETKVGGLEKVVTQPYDKISDEMQDRYYATSQFNLARIIRGKQFGADDEKENVYTRSEKYLQDWIARGILLQSEKKAFYAYCQEYEIPSEPGQRRLRKGFIGTGKLEDYSAGIVFPHEKTLTAPKEDRLKLLRQTRTHCGQIFMLYSDAAQSIDALLDQAALRSPTARVTDEYGVVHSLWRIEDPMRTSEIQRLMDDKKLIIADGHHRYETALNFRDECRAAGSPQTSAPASGELLPHEKVMMTFVNMNSAGLSILPTHRLVTPWPHFDLKNFIVRAQEYFNLVGFKYFTPEERQRKLEEFRHELREVGQVINTIGFYAAGTSNFYLMKLKGALNLNQLLPDLSGRQQKLDVAILHKLILERCLGISESDVRTEKYIRYVREFEEGLNAIETERVQLCFFLNPTRIEQVRDIALAGERLPPKSTDFYPKLLSGLTMYPLDAVNQHERI